MLFHTGGKSLNQISLNRYIDCQSRIVRNFQKKIYEKGKKFYPNQISTELPHNLIDFSKMYYIKTRSWKNQWELLDDDLLYRRLRGERDRGLLARGGDLRRIGLRGRRYRDCMSRLLSHRGGSNLIGGDFRWYRGNKTGAHVISWPSIWPKIKQNNQVKIYLQNVWKNFKLITSIHVFHSIFGFIGGRKFNVSEATTLLVMHTIRR